MSIHSRITNKKAIVYDGAKRTQSNFNYWRLNQPFEDAVSADRDVLKSNARYVHENIPTMGNADEAIVNNTIGTGTSIQSKSGDPDNDKRVESRFKNWCKKGNCEITGMMSFFDVEALVITQTEVDGELFVYMKLTREGLKLQLIESDNLDTSRGENGIEYDNIGRPTTYYFTDKNRKNISIPAEYIIHYFEFDARASQRRGISHYKQSLRDVKSFHAFNSATIDSAKIRARISHWIQTDRGGEQFGMNQPDAGNDNPYVEFDDIVAYKLKPDEEIKALNAQLTGDNYKDFVENNHRMTGIGRKMSYELSSRDYSKVNFASGKMSNTQDYKMFDKKRKRFEEHFLTPVITVWHQLEVLLGNLKDTELKVQWIFPKRPWMEPLKEMMALEMELGMGLTTNTKACRDRGEDFEENLQQIRKEYELEKDILGEFYELHIARKTKNKDLVKSILEGEEDAKDGN